jgi:hypothetical protein
MTAVVAFASVSFVASGQRPASIQSSQGAVTPTATQPDSQRLVRGVPLLISADGEKTPELIPDRLAYKHFILITAKRINASAEQVDRRESILRNVGFSKADHDLFISALIGVREELDQIAAERRQVPNDDTPAAFASLTVLKQREDAVFNTATVTLETVFSPEGNTRLTAYIREHVKRHIVVYGDLPTQ